MDDNAKGAAELLHERAIMERMTDLIAAGVTPERYMRAYWAANPPAQPDDESKMVVLLFEYGTTTAEYDRDEWRRAVGDDKLDHFIDHDASDLETDTLIVDGDGAIVEPY